MRPLYRGPGKRAEKMRPLYRIPGCGAEKCGRLYQQLGDGAEKHRPLYHVGASVEKARGTGGGFSGRDSRERGTCPRFSRRKCWRHGTEGGISRRASGPSDTEDGFFRHGRRRDGTEGGFSRRASCPSGTEGGFPRPPPAPLHRERADGEDVHARLLVEAWPIAAPHDDGEKRGVGAGARRVLAQLAPQAREPARRVLEL